MRVALLKHRNSLRRTRFWLVDQRAWSNVNCLRPKRAAAWVVENNRFQPWIFRLSIELQHRQRTHRIYTNMALPSISTPSSSGSIAPKSTARTEKISLSRGSSRNAAMEAKAAVGQSVAAKDVRSVDVASSARRTEREAGLLTNKYSSLLRSHKGRICHKK